MHSKLKSTVSGLAVVAAFVFATTLFGEPLPERSPEAAAEEAFEREAERVAAVLDDAQAAAETARRATLRRLRLTMPYFAVGRLLPATAES